MLAATTTEAVRRLDLAIAVDAADGTATHPEVVGDEDGFGAKGVTFEVQGLLGEEDLGEVAASIAPGFWYGSGGPRNVLRHRAAEQAFSEA